MRRSTRSALILTTAIALVLPTLPGAQAQDAASGPPGRVGQIALLHGAVSFNGSGDNGGSANSQWTQAALNYPITGGDALYTQPGAEAAIAIDWSRITLNQSSELQITRIGPRTVDVALSQGEAYLDIRYLRPGNAYVITTPRGTINITRNGRYDIRAGDQTVPTVVTVISGAAQLQGQSVSLNIGPGETATLQGANPVDASLGGARRDPFVTRMLQVSYAPPPSYVPPVVNQMTGGYQLAQYGNWSRSPQYGAIWYPRVAASWVPYRDGHWAYVAPWGWTWVDNDAWGFAPFHYGRWVQYGGRWGWAPAPVAYAAPAYYQPVYAPALVSFFNVGSGVAVSVGIGAAFAAGSIGWVPLAPREPYLPWYHAPQQYVRNINYYNVRNVNRYTTINNTTIINNYGPTRLINRGAATVIPAVAMQRGDPVARFGRPAPPMILAAARPVPPAGFHGPAGVPGPIGQSAPGPARPGGPVPHPAPGFGRLPGRPAGLIRPVVAQAPRPAPFAAARGLPVARPGPILGIAARPQIHVMAHNGFHPGIQPSPAAPARPGMPARPGIPPHPMPAAAGHPPMPAGRPMIPMGIAHPAAPKPPAALFHPQARPQIHPMPQQRPVVNPPQFHPPANRPVQQVHPVPHPVPHNLPPIQQFHPAPHPIQHTRPVQQFHPPAQQFHPAPQPVQHARPVQQFHPPVQQFRQPARPFHPVPQQARPQFHPPTRPPMQQFHPAPQPHPAPQQPAHHAPAPKTAQHP